MRLHYRGPGTDTLVVRCDSYAQRNWSRTAVARPVDAGSHVSPLFIKQFHHRDGAWDSRCYENELSGTALAQQYLSSVVVPQPLAVDEGNLILAYPYLSLKPPDELLRRDEIALRRAWSDYAAALRSLLSDAALCASLGDTSDLGVKHRPYRSQAEAVLFKGLEIRNVALTSVGPNTRAQLCFFDVGKPYLAPIEEGAARLVVSVLFLNWGRPLRRFVLGPPVDLASEVAEALGPWVSREALELECTREVANRLREVKASSTAGRLLKKNILDVLGTRYAALARCWITSV